MNDEWMEEDLSICAVSRQVGTNRSLVLKKF